MFIARPLKPRLLSPMWLGKPNVYSLDPLVVWSASLWSGYLAVLVPRKLTFCQACRALVLGMSLRVRVHERAWLRNWFRGLVICLEHERVPHIFSLLLVLLINPSSKRLLAVDCIKTISCRGWNWIIFRLFCLQTCSWRARLPLPRARGWAGDQSSWQRQQGRSDWVEVLLCRGTCIFKGVSELSDCPCGFFKTWIFNLPLFEGPSRGMASSLGLAKY